MHKVIIPLEEYNKLLDIQEDSKNEYKKQREEIEASLLLNHQNELNTKDLKISKYRKLYQFCEQSLDDCFTKITSYYLEDAPAVNVFNLKVVKEYHKKVEKKLKAVNDSYSIYDHYKNCLKHEEYGDRFK